MSNHPFEQQLKDQLTELDKDKQPDRDLWQGIDLALSQEAASHDANMQHSHNVAGGKKLYLLAATIAAFGLFGWLSFNDQSQNLNGEDLVAALSQQHLQQKNALLVKFQDQPALTQNWQQQLTELDEAADAIKSALENEPNNMALLKMLQTVHQQQINLIERVHSPKWSQI